MSDITKNCSAYEFASIQGYLNVLVSVIEGTAWALFGTSLAWQIGFGAWAVAMVWVRPYLFQSEQIAIDQGREVLATKISWLIKISFVVTCFSLYSLSMEAFEAYKAERQAESAPVLLAQSRLEQAEAHFKQVQEVSSYTETELMQAVSEKARLDVALQKAITQAQATILRTVFELYT